MPGILTDISRIQDRISPDSPLRRSNAAFGKIPPDRGPRNAFKILQLRDRGVPGFELNQPIFTPGGRDVSSLVMQRLQDLAAKFPQQRFNRPEDTINAGQNRSFSLLNSQPSRTGAPELRNSILPVRNTGNPFTVLR